MARYLSWDCGSKSLACVRVTFNDLTPFLSSITLRLSYCTTHKDLLEIAQDLNDALDDRITLDYFAATDLLKGVPFATTTEIERTKALASFLRSTPELVPRPQETIIVEHQLPKTGLGAATKVNNNTNIIAAQLCYHYNEHPIAYVNPKLKSQVRFTAALDITSYVDKTKPNAAYRARKQHAKDNMTYFLNLTNRTILQQRIPKKQYSDVADAFMQTIAHHRALQPQHR